MNYLFIEALFKPSSKFDLAKFNGSYSGPKVTSHAMFPSLDQFDDSNPLQRDVFWPNFTQNALNTILGQAN